MSTGSKPLFFDEDISWEPYFAKTNYEKKQTSRPAKSGSPFSPIDDIVDSRLNHIWIDAMEFCEISNLAFATSRRLESGLFQEIVISLQYRLLNLEYLDEFSFDNRGDPQNRLHEAVRCGLLALTVTIFLKIPNKEVRYHILGLQLKAALLALEAPGSSEEWEMRLWLYFMAGLSLFPVGERDWLVNGLKKCLRTLRLTSWSEAKVVLKQYLWIDMIHDTEGERVLGWCELINGARN